MAKKTYIYRVIIGHNGNHVMDVFMYARNIKVALDFCKEYYRDKRYNYFNPIKVGVSLYNRDTGLVSKEEDKKLRDSIAAIGDSYREREVVLPKFITKEEAGDLGL